jgi:adenylate kinase
MKLCVSGTPGTGKTTIARHLATRFGVPHIDISSMAHQMGWIVEADDRRTTSIIDVEEAREHVDALKEGIIDAHYAELFEGAPILVVRCPPQLLQARLMERRYSIDKVRENIMAEMVDSCLIAAMEEKGRESTFEIENIDRDHALRRAERIVLDPDPEESVAHRSTVHYLTEENLSFYQTL